MASLRGDPCPSPGEALLRELLLPSHEEAIRALGREALGERLIGSLARLPSLPLLPRRDSMVGWEQDVPRDSLALFHPVSDNALVSSAFSSVR